MYRVIYSALSPSGPAWKNEGDADPKSSRILSSCGPLHTTGAEHEVAFPAPPLFPPSECVPVTGPGFDFRCLRMWVRRAPLLVRYFYN